MDATTATLTGIGITAFVSIIALTSNYLIMKQTLRQSVILDIGKISLELKVQQLNELYGPLLLLIEQNTILARKLREGKGDPKKWRLLDHLPEVLKNPQDKALVDAIMDIDAKIENLIITKGGLVSSSEPPESFKLFLGHYRILKFAIDGNERTYVTEFEYYPREINTDVRKTHYKIKLEIDEMLLKYEHLLKTEIK